MEEHNILVETLTISPEIGIENRENNNYFNNLTEKKSSDLGHSAMQSYFKCLQS